MTRQGGPENWARQGRPQGEGQTPSGESRGVTESRVLHVCSTQELGKTWGAPHPRLLMEASVSTDDRLCLCNRQGGMAAICV